MSEKNFRSRAEVDAYYDAGDRSDEVIEPKGFGEKLANFWYYYKWHVIIGAFVAIVLAFGLAQCATKENPDYTVITAFDKYVPTEVTEAIEAELERYAVDRNGDGKTVVHIYDVSTAYDREAQIAQSTKLMSEMQRGEAMLLIVDDVYFDKLNGLDVFEQNTDLFPDREGKALNLLDSSLTDVINAAYEPIAVNTYGKKTDFISNNYYITKRVIVGTSFENNEKSVNSEQANLKMLEDFLSDLKFR